MPILTDVDAQAYAGLLAETLPGRITTEEENERALAVVYGLMKLSESTGLSPEQGRLLELLTALIEGFEEMAYPTGESTPVEMLRHLMEQHGLRQADLLPVFGSRSTVSQVLAGKRAISKAQAKRLAERFHTPADLFI